MSLEVQRRMMRRETIAALLSMTMAMLMAGVVGAQTTITVTSLADPAQSAMCTLRDAILIADGESPDPSSDCAPSGTTGPYTIVFSAALTGTIALDNELPQINATTLTIVGPATAPGITIDARQMSRVVEVNFNATLSLQYLTMANGFSISGGAILNEGSLHVFDSTFTGNVVTQVGAAITNGGPGSTLTVTNCTFSDNHSNVRGAGIASESRGATATVSNSTFFGNSAIFGGSAITQRAGTVTVRNTILASESTGGDNCYGSITDGGYNLSDDSTCEFSANGSKNGVTDAELALDPAGLKNNGGPTETVALAPASIAIDSIPQASCTFVGPNPCATAGSLPDQLTCDQRGDPRPDPEDGINENCDIGAYEFQSAPPPIDCRNAAAGNPNLVTLPLVFLPESVTGVSDLAGRYTVAITGVEQSKPVLGFPRCPNAIVRGTTTFVRATNQGSGNLLYSIAFEATDRASGASCTGAVPVCVQTFANRGRPCTGTPTYDATSCK